jgi:hypothetical protein
LLSFCIQYALSLSLKPDVTLSAIYDFPEKNSLNSPYKVHCNSIPIIIKV